MASPTKNEQVLTAKEKKKGEHSWVTGVCGSVLPAALACKVARPLPNPVPVFIPQEPSTKFLIHASASLAQVKVTAQPVKLGLGPHSLKLLGAQEQAPGDALVALGVVQLVGHSDALQGRHLGNGAHGEAAVHQAIVHKHVGHAEDGDAQACAVGPPLSWGCACGGGGDVAA